MSKRYKSYLVECYNLSFGTDFGKDYSFRNEELFQLTPLHVSHYFAKLAYGTIAPGAEDFPTECRSSTLNFAKKAISYYMPNKLMHWNEQGQTGNPTKSTLVNAMVKEVKKGRLENKGNLQEQSARWSFQNSKNS